MLWEKGNIKTNFFNFEIPTKEKFDSWKKEFLKLPNVDNYVVWVCGGFNETWTTHDIDIILTGEPNYKELRSILRKGIEIGIKYKTKIDISWWDTEPKLNTNIKKVMYGETIKLNNRIIRKYNNEVYKDLFLVESYYPTEKQKKRNYKHKPIRLN